MLLLVDVGNTNVVVGVAEGNELMARWRVATDRNRMPDEWWVVFNALATADGIDLRLADGAILSSVVPQLTQWIGGMLRERVGVNVVVVDSTTNLGVTIETDNPLEVGADRLVNAVAAYAAFGGPTLVIDFGTATTFDVISAGGQYLGGAIAPGIRLAHDALIAHAAKLSSVELVIPDHAIGTNTVASMQSGIMLGYAGLINSLIERIDAELDATTTVIATGGLGATFLPACPRISRYVPDLTLDGLRLIWDRNASS